ncbi:MAG: rod-binding protein [Nitrospinota bacterium]
MEFPNLSPVQLQQVAPQREKGAAEQLLRAAERGDEKTLRKVSQDFEGVFVHMLIKEMRKSVPKSGLFKDSMAREWFDGMLDEAVAREVSQGPGIGLAQVIYEQMKQSAGEGAGAKEAPAAAAPAPQPEEKKR